MKKAIKMLVIFLLFICLLPISYFSFAEGGDDNAGTGSGGTGGKVDGKGFYRGGEWMYKVSVYVGLSDTAMTSTSFYHGYKNIGDPVFVKPSNFSLPKGVLFSKHNKVEYLRGKGLSFTDSPKIIVDNPPAIPITNGGRLSAVKDYFGDSETLISLIDNVAQQQGTTWEGLVKNIEFTINGKKGKQNSNDILPIKGADGKYKNKVPWVIIYEPVTIAYLRDGTTKLAFTATEYALAQKNGLFNFFYSGKDAQYIAGMTHCNLPNSILLEKGWFDYTAFPPTKNNEKWDDTRIIRGGGWGMRIMYPDGSNTKEPIEPPVDDNDKDKDKENPSNPKNTGIGDYRVNTDVITSVNVTTSNKVTPDDEATVTFEVNGRTLGSMSIVLPDGGSQLVWTKWHTPSTAQTMNITARLSGNSSARFENGGRIKNITVKIVDLDENIPPDPRAKDEKTGKPVQRPNGWRVPKLPRKAEKRSATWGEWEAFWKANWVWHEDWRRVWTGGYNEDGRKEYEWEDRGKWVDEGDWEYFWKSYSATLSAEVNIKPDEKVPTAKRFYSDWEMKSGYGLNIDIEAKLISNAPSSSITEAQNAINYFPEFNYKTYWRLSDRTSGGKNVKFELKKNKYSTYNQRVHFTPLWFPDDEKYTTYSEVIDLWTPAGMLSVGLDDFINIKGNVFDDWRVVPGDPNK